MTAQLKAVVSVPELLGDIDTLRDGLLMVGSLLEEVEESPPPHQIAGLFKVFADAAETALRHAAPSR